MTGFKRLGIAALLLVLTAAREARAFVISEDELADKSLVAGVIARAFSFVLGGAILRPPYLPDDESPSAIGVLDLRPYFSWRAAGWKLVVHGELQSLVRSHAQGGALGLAQGAAPPRLLPLRAVFADQPTLSLTAVADWVYLAYRRGPVTVTLGRQPITFGRAQLWRPTDLVGTFALTEVDTEYKPGSDALRIDWSAGARTQVTLVAATGELEQDDDLQASLRGTSALAQLKQGVGSGEVGVLAGFVRRDLVAAADFVLEIGPVDVHGEGVATRVSDDSLSSPVASGGDLVARAVLGATFRPAAKLTVTTELAYNGFGARTAADYLAVALSERVAVGEQILLGRWYAGAFGDWELHPLVHVTAVALANMRDPSALFSLALVYSVSDNVQALLGGYLGVGERPLVPGLVARSEYGLYPAFAFVELKAAL